MPLKVWQDRLLGSMGQRMTALGEKGREVIASSARLNRDEVVADLVRQGRHAIKGLPPCEEPLSETAIDEDLHALAENTVNALLRTYSVPATNGHVQVPGLPANIDPDHVLRPLGLGKLYELYAEWKQRPWVWAGILPRGSLSLFVGKSESGKSTLVYALIYCIIRGLEFLGRLCEPGRVLYLAGDPASEWVAAETFAALGLTQDDPVMVLCDALVGNPHAWPQFRQIVADFKPTLIVLDTLGAAVNLDTDKYAQSVQAQQPLTKLAREFDPNILSLHHSQKAAVDAYNVVDAALGSVGVAAVASTRMVARMYRRGKMSYHTFEMSNLRIGQPIEGEWILEKDEAGMVSLGTLWADRESNLFEEAILKVVGDAADEITQTDVRDRIGMKLSRGMLGKKLAELVREGKLDVSRRGAKKYRLAAQGQLQ